MIVNCLGLLRKFFISSILKLSYVIQKLKKKLIYTSYILEFLTDIKLCGIDGKKLTSAYMWNKTIYSI